jgi:hypothetical protein
MARTKTILVRFTNKEYEAIATKATELEVPKAELARDLIGDALKSGKV